MTNNWTTGCIHENSLAIQTQTVFTKEAYIGELVIKWCQTCKYIFGELRPTTKYSTGKNFGLVGSSYTDKDRERIYPSMSISPGGEKT